MKKLSPFLPFLLLAWFTAGLIGYVAGHKPFSAEELLVWLQAAHSWS